MMLSFLLVAGLVATSTSTTWYECSEEWTLIDRTCFLFTDETGSWEAGQSFCNQRGANLATIASQIQQRTIAGMLSQSVWIGFNDRNVEGSWGWADGSEYSFTSWHNNEPNDKFNGEDCGMMGISIGYRWNDAPCTETRRFLCSKPPETIFTTPTTAAAPAPVCEEGWEMFEDAMCFKVSDGVASWPKAREACLAQYAQLAAVTSEAQQNFLAARLTGNTWIGLNDEEKEGVFTWADGTHPGYTNWIEDEPNNSFIYMNLGVGENCVEMRHRNGYMWNDHLCHTEKQFVCQKPPSTASCGLPTGL